MKPEPVKVLVMPADPNPYQALLYGELSRLGVRASYLQGPTRSQSANLLLLPIVLLYRRLQGFRVLHFHWVFLFRLPWAGDVALGRRVMQRWLELTLWLAHAIGFRIVWTAHNVMPHQRIFADDVEARRHLAERCDAVIVHAPASVPRIAELGASAVVIPQGGFGGVYPDTATRLAARARLGVGPEVRVITFVGRILDYKGVDVLLEAAGDVAPDLPLLVVVAGRCDDPDLARRLMALASDLGPRAKVRLGHIPDDELQWYFRAADVAVLPFRRITNSSSAQLAFAFGVPVLAPDLPELDDLADGARWRYRGGRDGLAAALSRLAVLPFDELRTAAVAAARAGDAGWEAAARDTLGVYRDVLRRSRRPGAADRRAHAAAGMSRGV